MITFGKNYSKQLNKEHPRSTKVFDRGGGPNGSGSGGRISDSKADYYNKGFTLRPSEWPLATGPAEAPRGGRGGWPAHPGLTEEHVPGSSKIQRAPSVSQPSEDYKDLWWENRPPIKKSKRKGETGRSEDI